MIYKAVLSGMLSKEYLSQFKTEMDISQLLKDMHATHIRGTMREIIAMVASQSTFNP